MTGEVVKASATDLIVAGCALATVAGGVALFLWRRSRSVMRKLHNFLRDWEGEPARPGVAARPGVMARLASTDVRLERIEGQLKPNGGTSFYDKVAQAVENNTQPAEIHVHTGSDR